MTSATQVRSIGLSTILDVGNIEDGDVVVRSGASIIGVPAGNIAGPVTPVAVTSGFNWGTSSEATVYASYNGADFEIGLVGAANVADWAPGTIRTVYAIPLSANALVFTAEDVDVVIQFGVAGTDYSVPGSDAAIGPTQLANVYSVLRGEPPFSMYYFVFGATPSP